MGPICALLFTLEDRYNEDSYNDVALQIFEDLLRKKAFGLVLSINNASIFLMSCNTIIGLFS